MLPPPVASKRERIHMKNTVHTFQGLTEDAYRFFWEIAFQNEHSFFEENRKRYEKSVKEPMLALADALGETALEVDANFNVRPSSVVSRIRRDTRYTKDKSPYRDHAFLSFKYPGAATGESFVLYAEFERTAYGYGMGMYYPLPQFMADARKRMLAQPQKFLEIVNNPAFTERFHWQGEEFKRPRFQDAPEAIRLWLNKRSMSFCFSSTELKNTMRPELVKEVREGYRLLKPLYRFLLGLDEKQ